MKMKKKIWIGTLAFAILSVSMILMVACKKTPSFPTGASAYVSGSTIKLTWNSVEDAEFYCVTDGEGSYITETYGTSYTDYSPKEGYNDYRVYAQNKHGRSSSYSTASCYYSGNGGGGGSIPVPTGVSAEVSGSKVYITWNSVSTASNYRIYRASSSNGSYSMLESTSSTYFYDASPNSDNYYKVTAVSSSGTESEKSDYAYCHYSSGGGGGGGSSTISAPTGVSAEVSGSRVCVTWNSVSNASYYKIYRASSSSGSYSTIESSTSNTYYYDASPNTYNYYKVTAVNSSGTESEKSDYAYCYYSNGGGGGGGTTIPDAPTGVYAENIGSTMVPEIKITWNSVSNATSYKVYKSTSPNSGYTQHGSSITSTYCYDHSPSQGKNYYKVKAVNSAGESSYSSYAVVNINSNDVEPCPPTVSASGTSNSISVSWIASTSSGCGRPTSYEVHKYNPINSSWEQLTATSSTSYTDRSPHPGVNRYIVKAINNYGEALEYGSSNSIALPKPTSFTAQKYGSDQVKLTWSRVNQATGYQIFWSTSAYSNYSIWEQVEDVTTLIKYLPGASGTTTYFKIRAIWQADGSFEYSDFSSWTSVTF